MLATLLSLLRNVPLWYIKVLDFPRIQVSIGLIVCLILSFICIRKYNHGKVFFLFGLISCLLIQVYYVHQYSTWVSPSVPTAEKTALSEKTFSILSLNVYMKNTDYEKTISVIKQSDADIVLLMETDHNWESALQELFKSYPYIEKKIYDNTYGMILLSKHPLSQTKVLEISNPKVPSIHTNLLIDNHTIRLHCVHPVPPVPSEHPDNMGEKENELKLVGQRIGEINQPHIIAGDFNDVSWSKNLRLFERSGKLNNVSYGRGFINTFDANSYFLRWPLDHFYVTKEFSVKQIKTLESVGSDHFPLYAEFVLN